MRKLAVVTCYKDYVRTHTIQAALDARQDVQAIQVKNAKQGVLRYPEVLWKLLKVRIRDKPDGYLLNFRGYELLPFVLLIAGRKPVIFDEFINLTEWVVDEHHKVKHGGLLARILNNVYGWLLRHCRVILADTPVHVAYSAERSGVAIEKYVSVPVGTDNAVFYPRAQKPTKPFTVLYYGSMLPLHGVDIVLAAAKLLQDTPAIDFHFVGGKDKIAAQIAAASAAGVNVRHTPWIAYADLPDAIAKAGINLAGPFGDTLQSQYVVTGKTYQLLAMAVPCIVGENIATTDFVDKQNSLVVPQGDAAALADAIRWAFEHPKELARIGKRGRALYEKAFDEPTIARQVRLALAQAGL